MEIEQMMVEHDRAFNEGVPFDYAAHAMFPVTVQMPGCHFVVETAEQAGLHLDNLSTASRARGVRNVRTTILSNVVASEDAMMVGMRRERFDDSGASMGSYGLTYTFLRTSGGWKITTIFVEDGAWREARSTEPALHPTREEV